MNTDPHYYDLGKLHDSERTSITNSLGIYINGNLYSFINCGFVAGPINKYLRPGDNTIEIEGVAFSPFDVNIASFKTDHRTISRVILSNQIARVGNVNWNDKFHINKIVKYPIFETRDFQSILSIEQEIEAEVKKLFSACISSNWNDFCRITLEGYKESFNNKLYIAA
jgi:hypothetical protein